MLPKCDVVVQFALDQVILICVQLEMEVMMQDSEGNGVHMSESMMAWAACRQGESERLNGLICVLLLADHLRP